MGNADPRARGPNMTREPIWITGIGAMTPLGHEYDAIAENLLAGSHKQTSNIERGISKFILWGRSGGREIGGNLNSKRQFGSSFWQRERIKVRDWTSTAPAAHEGKVNHGQNGPSPLMLPRVGSCHRATAANTSVCPGRTGTIRQN